MSEAFEVRRNVSAAELAKRRRQGQDRGRRRDFLLGMRDPALPTPDAVEGDTAYISKPGPLGARRSATDVIDALVDRRMQSMSRLAQKNPGEWQAIIAEMRRQHPGLTSSMTDDEIYRRVTQRMAKEATQRVFTRQGRNTTTI